MRRDPAAAGRRLLARPAAPAAPGRLGGLGTPVEHATFETLHTASLAAPPLRAGLTEETARRSARRLRSLLGTDALCLTDQEPVLVWDGVGRPPPRRDHGTARPARWRPAAARPSALTCDDPDCPLRWAVVAPLTVDDRVHGALVACAPRESAVLVRAAGEVARWVSVQLELADLDRSRTRLIEAEIKALRAQISPHFIFNSLAVIASFVRTDPERARELLLEFADFTRYSFRRHGDFTTLADELHSIDQYLALVRARFGDRLVGHPADRPRGAAGGAALPLPPAAGGERRQARSRGQGRASATSASPRRTPAPRPWSSSRTTASAWTRTCCAASCAGEVSPSGGIGLSNVDERLRQVYGDDYGLVIETARRRGHEDHRPAAQVPAGRALGGPPPARPPA